MNISNLNSSYSNGVNYDLNYRLKSMNSAQVESSDCATKPISTPETDTVSFKGKEEEKKEAYKTYSCKDADMLKYDLEYTKPNFFTRNYEIYGENLELVAKNKWGGAQNVSGNAYDEDFDVNIDSGLFGVRKGKVTGFAQGKELNIGYMVNENAKSIKLTGNIDELDDKNKALLIMLITDKVKHDLRLEQEAEMLTMSTIIR